MLIRGRLGYHVGYARSGPHRLVVPLAAFARDSFRAILEKAGLRTASNVTLQKANIIRYIQQSSITLGSSIIGGERDLS